MCPRLFVSSLLKIHACISQHFSGCIITCVQLCLYQIHLDSRKEPDSFHAFVYFLDSQHSPLEVSTCPAQKTSLRIKGICYYISMLYSVLLAGRMTLILRLQGKQKSSKDRTSARAPGPHRHTYHKRPLQRHCQVAPRLQKINMSEVTKSKYICSAQVRQSAHQN